MSENGVWPEYWASWFWERAGGMPSLPADIGYAVMCALDVYVEETAGLTTHTAAIHTGRSGVGISEGDLERSLHGYIVVGPGGAAILVERGDDAAQQRFTIAHEAAHFILEVKRHRDRATSKLGAGFADVLYGLREPTQTESIDAWLNNARSKAFTHFMDRTPGGGYGCAQTVESECLADDLALEILAPRGEMVDAVSSLGRLRFSESLTAARLIAEERFGLPAAIAARYANRLMWQLKGGPSTAERFGFVR